MYYMTDEMISVRVDRATKEQMKLFNHINWSVIIRRALTEYLEKESKIDKARVRKALNDANKIRNSGAFSGGKSSVEIIREWRNKRR